MGGKANPHDLSARLIIILALRANMRLLYGMDTFNCIEEIIALEQMAKGKGLTINEVCKQAGIARSTFSRAKNGETDMGISNYKRLRAVIENPPK